MFADLKERYPRTAYAQQAGMLAAKVQFDKGKTDDARASLDLGHRARGRRRLQVRSAACGWPALLLDAKQYDEALKQLDAVPAGPYSPRWRPTAAATCCWRRARRTTPAPPISRRFKAMDDKVEYRRLVDAKLTALGAAPAAAAAQAAPGASR